MASLLIRRLILVGHRKNYVVPFYPGLNIIYGDSATGKSSILECINYLLGSSKFVFDIEIETSVKYVALDIELNGRPHVFKRDIFDSNRNIEVYSTSFDKMESVFPKIFVPSYKQPISESGYFIDFLLGALGLPILKVRTAPTREDSSVARLSFRDLFKFCYLKQDDVGSRNLLNVGVPVLHSKTKQTFRYIFNLLDENVALLEAQLADLRTKHKRSETKYEDVSDFLRQSDLRSAISLDDELSELDSQVEMLESQLKDLNNRLVADSQASQYLRDLLVDHREAMALNQSDKINSERQVERFIRLRNDYSEDIDRIASVVKAKALLGEMPPDESICPICDGPLKLSSLRGAFEISSDEKLTLESLALGRRAKELDQLLAEERFRLQEIVVRQRSLSEEYQRASRLLDEEVSTQISPYLAERDGISAELATLRERRNQVENSAKIRRLQRAIFDEIEQLLEIIAAVNKKLDSMRENAPSLQDILGSLADDLNSYLDVVNIRDRRGIAINEKSLLPVLRNRDYRDVTSGGLRTILSIGYYLSIIKAASVGKANLPALLMIDTVGKYLGKTNASLLDTDNVADAAEGVTDPLKYQHMYEYMIDLMTSTEEAERDAQIIVVDNDIPLFIREKFAGYIVAQFSSTGEGGLPIGLIDDARTVS